MIPVYWDYYQSDESVYCGMIENHKQLSNKTWFAGGAWCWYGMIPYNRFTLQSMIPALNACKKHRIKNVFMTMWGDDGAECSHFSQLPSLFYLAEYAKGNTDEAKIKAKFARTFGIDFDEFMEIDCPNDVIEYQGRPCNPAKYMLYSDYFNGFMDYTIKPGAGEKYLGYSEKLRTTAKKSRRYGYVFDTAAKLCDVLAVKYDLGLRTREAYQAGDKDTLKALAENEYARLGRLLDTFARAFEKQWMTDNKPHGFDVQDLRLGGLIRRTDACRRRLLDYVNGKLDRIDELEEALLPFGEKEKSTTFNKAPMNATVNVLHHNHNQIH